MSQTISQLGTAISVFSIPHLISFLRDGDETPIDLAITYAIEATPVFLIGLLGGVLLDRWPLRPVIIATNLLRGCAFFYLAGASNTGSFGLGTVFAMAFIIGTYSTLFDGAIYSTIPRLVRRDGLADANSLVSVSIQVNAAIGPFIGGVLAAWFGTPDVGLFLCGFLFVAGAIGMRWVGPIHKSAVVDNTRRSFLTDASNGIRYLWAEERLRLTTVTAAVANFVMGFIEGTYRILFKLMTGAPTDFEIGLLLAAMGVGGVLGALMAPSLTRRLGLGRTLVVGLWVIGLLLFAFMFTGFGPLALVLAAGWSIGVSVVNVPLATIRQHYSSEAMLGRVITASRAIGWAPIPLGALIGAWLGGTPDSYPWVARTFPLLVIATALWLMSTVVWTNTFGPGFEREEVAEV